MPRAKAHNRLSPPPSHSELGAGEVKVIDLSTAEGREEWEAVEAKEESRSLSDQFEPKQGVFEYVVLSHVGILPGAEGYEAEKDRLMIGFRYGNNNPPTWFPYGSKITEVTAYDFLTNPKTGMREGQKIKPHGTGTTMLANGITAWSDLPPLAIWKNGRWLSQIIWEEGFDLEDLPYAIREKVKREMENWPKTGVPASLYNFYVTSGEGTTGNNIYRIFELPAEVCGRTDPHHPLMWPERLKKPTGTYYEDQRAYKGESWREETLPVQKAFPPSTTTTTTKPSTPAIPAGVRMRCPGCGHWYSYQDLIQHSAICGDPDKIDWVIMCHPDCGCSNLDQAASPKPGFPRPKKEVQPVEAGGDSEDPS